MHGVRATHNGVMHQAKAMKQFISSAVAIMLVGSLGLRTASASPEMNTSIRELWANSESNQNVVWLRAETSFTSSCGVTSDYMVIDLSEPGMREAYAMLLSAFYAGRNVRVRGMGACFGQFEKIKYVILSQ